MRTLGLIGGMSWESTLLYYRQINERVRERLGGLHSAKLLLYSVDFAEVEALQRVGDWTAAGALMLDVAKRLQGAGADALVICTNTMHLLAPDIEREVDLPLLHIADVVAHAIRARGLSRVALLGTRFTMEQAFYRDRLASHGLDVRVPGAAARDDIHRVIYEELCRGEIRDDSRQRYRAIIDAMVVGGAECVVLGCTEIGLLIGDADAAVPVLDTTALHARAAADWAIDG